MRHLLTSLTFALACFAAVPASAESTMSEGEREVFRAEVRDYLLENPEILVEMLALLEERQKTTAAADEDTLIAEHAAAIFDDGFSYVGGNPEGSVTLVEFSDYQCGFCRRAHPEVSELIASDGDIRLIVKEMPILGPGSELAARAAIATLIEDGPEAYARLNDALMSLEGPVTDASLDRAMREAEVDPDAIRPHLQDEEVSRRIAETRELADALQIAGTPTFVFGDRMLRGYVPLEAMRDLVGELRAPG